MASRIRFIPVKDGDLVDLGDTSTPTTAYYARKPKHLILGFKPGPGPKAVGWLVVLVDEDAKPKTQRPRKLRAVS
jgi:hypothetical protein